MPEFSIPDCQNSTLGGPNARLQSPTFRSIPSNLLFFIVLMIILGTLNARATGGAWTSSGPQPSSRLCERIFAPTSNRILKNPSTLQETFERHTPGSLMNFILPTSRIATEDQEKIFSTMLKKMEAGYRLRATHIRRTTITLDFTPDLPLYVVEQLQDLKLYFDLSHAWKFHQPSARERSSHSGRFVALTSKNLSLLDRSLYSFVLMTNESALRLGNGHPEIGEMRSVYSAGDLVIDWDPETASNTVMFMSNRTDTYRPELSALPAAVFALWAQGIFPKVIELRAWDNATVLYRFPSASVRPEN